MTPCSVKALSTVKCTDGESALIEKYFAVVGCGGGGGAVVRRCGGAVVQDGIYISPISLPSHSES